MKPQYLVGIPKKEYIIMSDGRELIGGSLTINEAKEMKEQFIKSKIYRLVEVKK